MDETELVSFFCFSRIQAVYYHATSSAVVQCLFGEGHSATVGVQPLLQKNLNLFGAATTNTNGSSSVLGVDKS